MALQFNRTDANTGHVWTVYARIDDSTALLGSTTSITLNLYDSIGAAHSGLHPVMPPDRITLTLDDATLANPTFINALAAAVQAGAIQSPQDALKASLYFMLKQRPAYAGSLDV